MVGCFIETKGAAEPPYLLVEVLDASDELSDASLREGVPLAWTKVESGRTV